MGKECGAWVSRRLWGGGNTSPLKTTAWEASIGYEMIDSRQGALHRVGYNHHISNKSQRVE